MILLSAGIYILHNIPGGGGYYWKYRKLFDVSVVLFVSICRTQNAKFLTNQEKYRWCIFYATEGNNVRRLLKMHACVKMASWVELWVDSVICICTPSNVVQVYVCGEWKRSKRYYYVYICETRSGSHSTPGVWRETSFWRHGAHSTTSPLHVTTVLRVLLS